MSLLTLRRIIVMAAGLIIVSAGLTLVFLGMRAVMDVGGACGSGGPYVVATPCPDGVAALIPLGIIGGLIGLLMYTVTAARLPGPRLALLSWSALFLSLGWNFWEYGLKDGPVWGWIICGVVFILMGGIPLLGLLNRDYFRATFWADAGSTTVSRPVDPLWRAAPAPPPDGVAESLAQLAHLHQQGALTDEEFRAAKRRVLEQS